MTCPMDISPHWCVGPTRAPVGVEVAVTWDSHRSLTFLPLGCEAFPPAPRPGSEADGPGVPSHDRELQCQIRLSARQEEVEARGQGKGRWGGDAVLMQVLGCPGFWRSGKWDSWGGGKGTRKRGRTWMCCPCLAQSVQLSSALFSCSNRAALHLYSNTLNFQ